MVPKEKYLKNFNILRKHFDQGYPDLSGQTTKVWVPPPLDP